MTRHALRCLEMHVDALYTYDAAGRVTGCNQFDGGDAPRFHLARSVQGNFCRFSADLPADIAAEIRLLVDEEPLSPEPQSRPRHEEKYRSILSSHRPIEAVWRGPVFRFQRPEVLRNPNVVEITPENAELLSAEMSDWLPDVPHRYPFMAYVEAGRAVAVCASARVSSQAHEAGLETIPSCRRRGFGASAAVAWASAVLAQGAEALYSTSWDNHASRCVANSLELELVGNDFHVR